MREWQADIGEDFKPTLIRVHQAQLVALLTFTPHWQRYFLDVQLQLRKTFPCIFIFTTQEHTTDSVKYNGNKGYQQVKLSYGEKQIKLKRQKARSEP